MGGQGRRMEDEPHATATTSPVTIAGGPAPLIAATLEAWMAGAPWGVCVYVIAISLVTAFAVWCGPETYKSDIRADDVQDCEADARSASALALTPVP